MSWEKLALLYLPGIAGAVVMCSIVIGADKTLERLDWYSRTSPSCPICYARRGRSCRYKLCRGRHREIMRFHKQVMTHRWVWHRRIIRHLRDRFLV